jgi:UDP-4-amino-4,6-dideoxy-N-acetyl-beta-L-altrosamine transaminase
MIPYGKQDINQADIEAVIDVLNSDFITQGPKVIAFEKLVANYCNADFGVAVNSATSALHISCLALGLGKNDWLWTSPNSFVASANCGIYCGAKIDFVDIDPISYNICVDELEKKLLEAKKKNLLPKILIPVHFAGQSCNMQKIYELSKIYGFKIIEDASHAIGAKYLDEPIGNCEFSDVTVFSFHPVKIITTAEGGLATTNSSKLFKKLELYRSHGVTRNQELMHSNSPGSWYYEQIDLGFNYRMTEIQAALGISQMKRLDEFVNKRHILKDRYDSLLEDLPIVIPSQNDFSHSSMHLYPILVDLKLAAKSRSQIFEELRNLEIGVNIHYIPIHLHPYYQKFGFQAGDFPKAENYYSQAISLPLFSSMSIEQQDQVINTLRKTLL